MPANRNTDSEKETSYLDHEDWQIAFEPYEGYPYAALTLGFHLTELKRYMKGPMMHQGLAAIDRALDCLYEHSDFRSVSRDLFQTAIAGKLTTEKEELIRELGITI